MVAVAGRGRGESEPAGARRASVKGPAGKRKLKESQGIQKAQKDLGVASKEGHCRLQGMEHAGRKKRLRRSVQVHGV